MKTLPDLNGDDDAIVDRPEVFVAFPPGERFAVEELDGLVLAFARGHDGRFLFLVFGRGRREADAEDEGE